MFEAEGNNLRFKFIDRTASEEDSGSLYGYGQVRHREGNMQ